MKFLLSLIILAISNISYSQSETYGIEALQEVIYYEARGESFAGKVSVAQVVLNRVESDKFPKTIHEVRSQSKQFSYYNKPFRQTMKDSKARLDAFIIAVGVYTGIYKEPKTTKSLFYVVCKGKKKVSPKWLQKLKYNGNIGNHCFYTSKED